MSEKKLVVLIDGRRASNIVHKGENAVSEANQEAEKYRASLVESGGNAAARIEVKELVLG